jgi:hypothetical protein
MTRGSLGWATDSKHFYFRTEHEKFAASSVLPVPLYFATRG